MRAVLVSTKWQVTLSTPIPWYSRRCKMIQRKPSVQWPCSVRTKFDTTMVKLAKSN